MNKSNIVSVSVLVLTLYGCASGAQFENMAYTESPKTVYDASLKNEIKVKPVLGGEETNPLWTSEISAEAFQKSVENSLASSGLLSRNGRYSLNVTLTKVEQPFFGLDLRVTVHVNYLLVDTQTKKIIFDEVIVAPYTATFGDSVFAIKRLRLANEGAAKNNIETFMKRLSKVKISKHDISLTKQL